MTVMTRLPLQDVIHQDERWVDGQLVTEMDRHHRANLIPFLRRNAQALYAAHLDVDQATLPPTAAEEWLEQTPLMRRLTALEAGRPIEERAETAQRNAAHEAETGYQKLQLRYVGPIDDDGWWEP